MKYYLSIALVTFFSLNMATVSGQSSPLPKVTPSPQPKPTLVPTPKPLPKPTIKPTPLPTAKPRPTIQVPATANLVTTLSTAKAGTLYVLAAHANYKVNGTIIISAVNVSVNLNGATLALTPSAGASTNISINTSASHFEFYNGVISQANVAFRSYAPYTSIHNISTPNQIEQFYFGEKTASNTTLSNLNIGVSGSVGVYWVSDYMAISASTFASSLGEYCLRQDLNALGDPLPKMSTITNVSVTNVSNAYNKSAIGIRMGSSTISNATIAGYIRIGQSESTGVGSNNPSVIIRGCTFTLPAAPQISIDQGVNIQVLNNTFNVDSNNRSMSVDGFTKAIIENNVVHPINSTVVPKLPIWATNNTTNPPVVTYSGNIVK